MTEEEKVTREEIQEEWDFVDAVIDTKVMEITRDFLIAKGKYQLSITWARARQWLEVGLKVNEAEA